jgi:hypothetical protein
MTLSRHAACLLLLCTFSVVSGCAKPLPPQSEWVAFTTSDGKVTARFPQQPTTTTQSIDSAIGKLDFQITMTDYGSKAFLINHLTYPVDPSQYDVALGLAGAAEGAAQNVNGTLEENDDITLSGFPGKSLLIKTPQGAFVRGKICIDPAGPTLIQIQCVGPKDFVDGADARGFLESLKVN